MSYNPASLKRHSQRLWYIRMGVPESFWTIRYCYKYLNDAARIVGNAAARIIGVMLLPVPSSMMLF